MLVRARPHARVLSRDRKDVSEHKQHTCPQRLRTIAIAHRDMALFLLAGTTFGRSFAGLPVVGHVRFVSYFRYGFGAAIS